MFQRSAENRQFQMFVVCGAVFATLVLLVMQTSRVVGIALVNGDVAWYFFIAQKFLGGALFQDIYFDTNPPFPAIVYAVPVSVSGWLSVPLLPTAICLIFILVVVNAIAISKYLRDMTDGYAFITVPLCYLFYFLPHSYTDWGHKDYIVALCLPSVILAQISFLTKNEGREEVDLVLKILFFVNVFLLLLKPHYLLVVFAMIAVRMSMNGMRGSLLKPDVLALTLFVPSYFVVNYILFPDYYSLSMPVALNLYAGQFLSVPVGLGVCLSAIAALCYILHNGGMQNRLPLLISFCFLGVTAVSIGVYCIQGHGFSGHKLPAYVLFLFSAALVAQFILSHIRVPPSLVVLFFMSACMASTLLLSERLKFYTQVYVRGMDSLINYVEKADGDTFFMEGAATDFLYTSGIYAQKEPVSRFPSRWILDFYERGATPDDLEKASIAIPEIKLFGDFVSQDFSKNQPDFIMLYKDDIIDSHQLFPEKKSRSMSSFLKGHQGFNDILSQYEKVDEYSLSFYEGRVIMVYDVLRRRKY